jgi:hypothetical protein
MKKKRKLIPKAPKRKYVKPDIERIPIDYEISLVMMSESVEPPPENIGIVFNPIKFLR